MQAIRRTVIREKYQHAKLHTVYNHRAACPACRVFSGIHSPERVRRYQLCRKIRNRHLRKWLRSPAKLCRALAQVLFSEAWPVQRYGRQDVLPRQALKLRIWQHVHWAIRAQPMPPRYWPVASFLSPIKGANRKLAVGTAATSRCPAGLFAPPLNGERGFSDGCWQLCRTSGLRLQGAAPRSERR